MQVKDSEIGFYEVWEQGKKTDTPCYTCGHCNGVRLLRAERVRPRARCKKCSRLICEKTEICKTECTPIPDLAMDRMQGLVAGRYKKWAEAALAQAPTKKEAIQKGLVLEA